MTARAWTRWTLAAIYIAFGVFHLTAPDSFLPIMPAWVPMPRAVVLFTGACEVIGGAGLLIARVRWVSGLMLAIYALCVWPANIHHAIDHISVPGLPSSWWYHGPRMVLQPVLIWLALYVGDVIDWPFRQSAPSPARPLTSSAAPRRPV